MKLVGGVQDLVLGGHDTALRQILDLVREVCKFKTWLAEFEAWFGGVQGMVL